MNIEDIIKDTEIHYNDGSLDLFNSYLVLKIVLKSMYENGIITINENTKIMNIKDITSA